MGTRKVKISSAAVRADTTECDAPRIKNIPAPILEKFNAGTLTPQDLAGIRRGAHSDLSILIFTKAKELPTTEEEREYICAHLDLLEPSVKAQIMEAYQEAIRRAIAGQLIKTDPITGFPIRGPIPVVNEVSIASKLPLSFVREQLKNETLAEAYDAQLSIFKAVVPNLLSRLYYKGMTEGHPGAIRLFLETVGISGQAKPIYPRQTNYIQANTTNYQIEQAIINALPPEARHKVEQIILNALQGQATETHTISKDFDKRAGHLVFL